MPLAKPPRAPDPAPPPGPAIILVRPQLAENIGMAARAMANFGLADLRLVAPRDGWPQKSRLKKGAHAAASGAHGVLETARLFADVREASADLGFLWATTARERGQGKRVAAPELAMREAAQAMVGDAPARHGVVFGPERTGLASDEISLADAIVTFPVDPAFPSLNLSQAVLLIGYEWFRHGRGGALPFAAPELSPPASRAEAHSFFEYLEAELAKAGHFAEVDKRPVMTRNLRNILHRIGMTSQDVRTLRGVVISLAEGRQKRGG